MTVQAGTIETTGSETTWPEETLAFARRALLGAAAGGFAGIAIGGIGGRLAMLLLRLTSPDYVLGLQTDDGFEVGVVTFDTLNLLAATALLGAVAGLFVSLALLLMPWGWAPWAWALPGATVGGAALIRDEGLDFTLLDPLWLAVVMFVAIPALGLLCTAWLVRRWEKWWWLDRRRTVIAAVSAWPIFVFFPVALAVLALAAVWGAAAQRSDVRRLARGRLGVTLATCAFAGVTLAFLPQLIRDVRAVL